MGWNVDDIGDQSTNTVLVTGATAGIGLATVLALAKRNCHLILACRNSRKMGAVAEQLRAEGAREVDELLCDLSDLEAVRQCATKFIQKGFKIDVLVLNARISSPHYETTRQGYELMFGTNHLGHFLLCGLLLKYVKKRIVIVSAVLHKNAKKILWDIVSGEKQLEKNDPIAKKMYAQSKLANLLFMEELNRRLEKAGAPLIVVGAHPGWTKSEILDKWKRDSIWHNAMKLTAQETKAGALPVLMAITDSAATAGDYYGPKGIGELRGAPHRGASKSKLVTDESLGKECWERSERLTGVRFDVTASVEHHVVPFRELHMSVLNER